MVQENGRKYSSMVRPSKQSTKPSTRSSNKKSNSGKRKEDHESLQPEQTRSYQQRILNVFQTAFSSVLSSENLTTILQEVKTALFNRDFDKAFGNEDYLDAYAARWSPTRALCYSSVLNGIRPHLDKLLSQTEATSPPPAPAPADSNVSSAKAEEEGEDEGPKTNKLLVLAIGGGAAEIVALASFIGQQQQQQQTPPAHTTTSALLLDVAPWGPAVEKLRAALTTRPEMSKYASASARAANAAVVEDAARLDGVAFRRGDVLSLTGGKDDISSLLGGSASASGQNRKGEGKGEGEPVLVTLLFTLNELFNSSPSDDGVGRTTALLFALTGALPAGSLLLVVDSPGSYSEAAVGGSSRRYPMRWLLDRVLLQTAGGAWEKVESRESAWFRLSSQGLEYPIPLEDMRYQMHLYRATGGGTAG
ncbi:hypothetical protein SLS53_003401 [Cytospora paraplurivora]|uniref:25S rRNA (Uridine(2843)-N(3))-methyltransferase n=1 Tax=Cytospora paraplurivora TaxID=2898453 RepID=A0AAN9YHT3_9PEZI